MDKRNGWEMPGSGLWGKLLTLLIILLLFSSCSPSSKSEEEMRGEINDLKKEVKALGEKLDRLEGSQQTMLKLMKQPGSLPEAAGLPPQQPPQFQPQFQPPPMAQPLTVDQLIAGKDQYIGARVTVKGEVGPVMVHHKSLFLKSKKGMVEVLLGKLPDEKQVQRLTSTPIEQPLTVTGVVILPPRPSGAAKLQLEAEAVDF